MPDKSKSTNTDIISRMVALMGSYKIKTKHGHPPVFYFTPFVQILNSVIITPGSNK